MYKCKLCRLLITWDDLTDPEWGCGRCTMDDWIDERPAFTNDKKTIVIDAETYDNMAIEIARLKEILREQDECIGDLIISQFDRT